MPTSTLLCRTGLLGALAIAFWSISVARGDDEQKKESAQAERRIEVPNRKRVIREELIDDLGALSKYWLNMRLTSVPKVLDEQLELHGEGAVVSQVGPDGPAAKAGLKVNDVVTAVGETPIRKIADVAEAVDKAEGKEVTLKVIRAGKPITVTITPVERYGAGGGYSKPPKFTGTSEIEVDIQKLEEKIREKLKDAGVDVRMHLIQPGKMLPHGIAFPPDKPVEYPDNVSVEIRKQGKKPAEITVKQGDKSWNVKEDQISELPEDLRPYVESLRGRPPVRFSISLPEPVTKGFTISVPPPGQPKLPSVLRGQSPEAQQHARDSLEKRLDEMSREMNRMRERMEELRQSLREKPDRDDD